MTNTQQLQNAPHPLKSHILHASWQPGATFAEDCLCAVWVTEQGETREGIQLPHHIPLANIFKQCGITEPISVDRDIARLSGLQFTQFIHALSQQSVDFTLSREIELFVRVYVFAQELVKHGEFAAIALPSRLSPSAALDALMRMAESGDDSAPLGAAGNGKYTALWVPTWSDLSTVALRRQYLSSAEVWKCSWQADCGWKQRDHARIVLDLWVCKAVDHAVRLALTNVIDALVSEQKTSYRVMYRGEEDVFTNWRRALQFEPREFEADGWLVTRVVKQGLASSGWRKRTLIDASGENLYTISFELVGPSTTLDDWSIQFFIEHRVFHTKRSLEDYFTCEHRSFAIGRDLLVQPDVWILQRLFKAAEAYSPILDALSTSTPWLSLIAPEDVYAFITEALPRLRAAGFTVHTPVLDHAEASNVRIRVHVKKAKMKKQSVLHSPNGVHWFDADQLVEFDWGVAIEDQEMSKAAFIEMVEKRTPYVQLGGSWRLVPLDDILKQVELLTGNRAMGLTNLLDVSRMMLQSDEQVDTENPVAVDIAFDDEAMDIAQVLRVLASAHEPPLVATPSSFQGTLRHYQAIGFAWLVQLRSIGCGACLADDMGLGKTIQVLAYFLHLKETKEIVGVHLLVCPTSLVQNWKREIARFAPSLGVYVHHGVVRNVESDNVHPLDAARDECDLVLTTYATAVRDADLLQARTWDTIVLDEAQNIKNALTKQSEAVSQLRGVQRIALTGTPVENRLEELWAIFHFVNPGYLGNRAWFRRIFAEPITNHPQSKQATRLQHLLRPVLLRRRKTDPSIQLELPEKWEMRSFASLTIEQASVYQSIVNQLFTGIGERGAMSRRGQILAALVRLKQVCDHPCLVTGGSPDAARSGKLKLLIDLLEDVVADGECALIFTQFRDMGDLICDALAEHFGWRPKFLHGGLTANARGNMVEAFQSGADASPVFVLSLKAGGVGLNLTRANHVFHFDRWWNPAVEDQATDRAFRIGQERDVQVHKLVCGGTLEERIDALIESKRQLSAAVIGESSESWVTELDDESLRQLFMLDEKLAVEGDD